VPEPFRLLITGSRSWTDTRRIHGALDGVLAQMEPGETLVVVHGDNPAGADAIARRWVYVQRGATVRDVREERHPAQWGAPCRETCRPGHRRQHDPAGDYCPAAGNYRNAEMVAAGAGMCLAYIRSRSRGAMHCADLAEAAGIDTRRFTA
jgi:hypothetical protein